MPGVLHTEPRAARLFLLADQSFRLGDRGRYALLVSWWARPCWLKHLAHEQRGVALTPGGRHSTRATESHHNLLDCRLWIINNVTDMNGVRAIMLALVHSF